MYPRYYLYHRLKTAKVLMDRHYMEDLDLEEISRRVYLSKFHFVRLFRKAFGTTPRQYMLTKRIHKAKQLLLAGQSVTQVCHEVGFQSLPSFSILFKKATGVSPSQFKLKESNSR